ncbi:MAG TPA: MlaD family protein [Mycobacteriales bacterium]|nr:MlaD family protein [Mycobacteriales bacterium]
MISRRVKIQLVAFVIISFLGVIYTGLTYVGIHPFGGPFTVTAYFRDSGGIFANAQVTERGVLIGKVGSLSFDKNVPNGVAVHLQIDSKYKNKIPADSNAMVADLSAVGEQYVDIEPQTMSGPYLRDGGVISLNRTSIPVDDATILLNLDKFVTSVNIPQLETVISELGNAFQDTGPALQRLIDAGDALTQTAKQNLPTDIALLDSGRTVLDTQQALNGDLQAFTANLAGLSGQLVSSDPDLRSFLDNGVLSAQQLQQLLQANQTDLPVLLSNLVTLAQVQEVRIPGLKTILALYPSNVANGFLTAGSTTPGQPLLGHAHFGIATTQNPAVCTTGYGTTPRSNVPSNYGGPANLNTYCNQSVLANGGSSGPSDVRGARNSPRPPGDSTENPPPGGYKQLPGATYPSGPSAGPPPNTSGYPSASAAPAARGMTIAPYDPLTGVIRAPDGQTYVLGDSGGEQQYLGNQSWQWLLLAPVLG